MVGDPRISGLTMILPYLERADIYSAYQLNKDWADDTEPGVAPAVVPFGTTATTPTYPALIQESPTNRRLALTRIPLFNCPSSTNPNRLDGEDEFTGAWAASSAAVTDYSPTLGVSYLLSAGPMSMTTTVVDFAGGGILSQTQVARLADVKDGLSNTIMYAESAGRPSVYRRNKIMGTDPASSHVNGGGWARPGSDFFVDGSSLTNPKLGIASFGGVRAANPVPINLTNGEDIGSVGYSNMSRTYALANTNTNNPQTNSSTSRPVGAMATATRGSYGTGEVYAFHTGGANIGFGDGSVRFMSANIGLRDFARMVTRENGEIIIDTAQ